MPDTDSTVPVLVPEGKSFADLTLGELDAASYRLGADVLEAVSGAPPGKRYGALVEIAVVWAKRSGDTASRDELVKRFRDYTADDIQHALRQDEDDQPDEPDPTSSSDESGESSSLERSDVSPATSTGSTT